MGNIVLHIQQQRISIKGNNIIGTGAVKICLWPTAPRRAILCFPVSGPEYQLHGERELNGEELQDIAPF